MRKLTVLLLAGALLAITGGASVARAEDFAIRVCGIGASRPDIIRIDTSFGTPDGCEFDFSTSKSCSVCVDAITKGGKLKLVDVIDLDPNIMMLFSTKKGVLKDD